MPEGGLSPKELKELREEVLEVLRSDEGRELIRQIKEERKRRRVI